MHSPRTKRSDRPVTRRLRIEPLLPKMLLSADVLGVQMLPALEVAESEGAAAFVDVAMPKSLDIERIEGLPLRLLEKQDLTLFSNPPAGYCVVAIECGWGELEELFPYDRLLPENNERGPFFNNLAEAAEGESVPTRIPPETPVMVFLLVPRAALGLNLGEAGRPVPTESPTSSEPPSSQSQNSPGPTSLAGSFMGQAEIQASLPPQGVDQALAGWSAAALGPFLLTGQAFSEEVAIPMELGTSVPPSPPGQLPSTVPSGDQEALLRTYSDPELARAQFSSELAHVEQWEFQPTQAALPTQRARQSHRYSKRTTVSATVNEHVIYALQWQDLESPDDSSETIFVKPRMHASVSGGLFTAEHVSEDLKQKALAIFADAFSAEDQTQERQTPIWRWAALLTAASFIYAHFGRPSLVTGVGFPSRRRSTGTCE